MRLPRFCLTLASALTLAAPALAEEPVDAPVADTLTLGLGYFDVFGDEGTGDLRAEYRSGTPLVWAIRPWGGGEITGDGAIYAAGGLLADWEFQPNWTVTPSFGGGLYLDGGGKDLGSALIFRSQVEVGYTLPNQHRVSGQIGHLSNLGLDDTNPGATALGVAYHVPLDR